MNKQAWVDKINEVLSTRNHFLATMPASKATALVFACDVFRRRKHKVEVNIEASETKTAILKVVVSKATTMVEFTVRRDDEAQQYIRQIGDDVDKLSVRGCGTVIATVFEIVEWAIHNGWLIEKSFMGTLTQNVGRGPQRNTTFHAVLRKG